MRARPVTALLALAIGLFGVSGLARADRLINVPVATKLLEGSIRYEEAFGLSDRRETRESLLYAYDKTFEVEARRLRSDGDDSTTFDLYATIISPFKGYAPGIAVGMRDVLGKTNDGRRAWVAVTFREAFQVGDLERGMDFTIGGFIGNHGSALIGFSIPFGPNLRLLAENDGYRLSAGVNYSPVRNLELRFITEDRVPLGSFRYSYHF